MYLSYLHIKKRLTRKASAMASMIAYFLALLLLRGANGAIVSYSYIEPTHYPTSVNQFREPDPWMLKNIPPSSRFKGVVRISLHRGDLPDGAVGIDKQRRTITVAYGKTAEYQDTFETVFGMLWDGIDEHKQKLQCDEPIVTCSIKLVPMPGLPMGDAKFNSTFPGVFEVVAQGAQNHRPVKNIWRLYSVPSFIIEEGRYFNISLDFVQVAHKTAEGDIVVHDGMMAYLNLEWKNDSNIVHLYGMPGVGELEQINILDIDIHQDRFCAYEQSECPRIKVKLTSQPWQGLIMGPSFEATFSSHLISTDDRIAAAKCVAQLYGAHINDLRGVHFIDEPADMASGSITKIRGIVVPGFNDCDAVTRLGQITWPPRLALCKATFRSLKHDLDYWKKRCPFVNLDGLQEISKFDLNRLNRLRGASTAESLLVKKSRPSPTPLGTSKSSITAAAQTPSTTSKMPFFYFSTKPMLPDQYTPPEDANVILHSADIANSKSSVTSKNHKDIVDVASVSSLDSVLPSATVKTPDIDNFLKATKQFEDDNGENLSEPVSPRPFWSNLQEAFYRSLSLHTTAVFGFILVTMVVIFIWQFRQVRKSAVYC
ncbi:hypothetical protein BIW11_05641 [Tropilaelaps mercedesae]|uniref:Uncharacterized protein n=1 Tax=Tropilaelaps mercedesae TaxID=418985 RepID=A0A1V9Y1F6_9ACAR|nr:hypothetical protein BIW11_05641 [Tropilaelaps mercedesae]